MDPEIIDLIYQNDEVVGVAVFSNTGDLIENQLSINDESISVVAQTISGIASALHNAEPVSYTHLTLPTILLV